MRHLFIREYSLGRRDKMPRTQLHGPYESWNAAILDTKTKLHPKSRADQASLEAPDGSKLQTLLLTEWETRVDLPQNVNELLIERFANCTETNVGVGMLYQKLTEGGIRELFVGTTTAFIGTTFREIILAQYSFETLAKRSLGRKLAHETWHRLSTEQMVRQGSLHPNEQMGVGYNFEPVTYLGSRFPTDGKLLF